MAINAAAIPIDKHSFFIFFTVVLRDCSKAKKLLGTRLIAAPKSRFAHTNTLGKRSR
jgi:hypothetical protein